MAEEKRKPGRPPGSKNNTNGAEKTSAKNSGKAKSGAGGGASKQANSAAKKSSGSSGGKAAAKPEKQIKPGSRVKDEIWSLIIMSVSVFLIIAMQTQAAGRFGEIISAVLKGSFGLIGYILPYYLLLYGIMLFAKRTAHIGSRSIVFLIIIYLMVVLLNAVRYIDPQSFVISLEEIKNVYAAGSESGGLFGMYAGGAIVQAIGKPGLCIFAVVMILISALLVVDTPISQFLDNAKAKKVERQKERAERAAAEEIEQEKARSVQALQPVSPVSSKAVAETASRSGGAGPVQSPGAAALGGQSAVQPSVAGAAHTDPAAARSAAGSMALGRSGSAAPEAQAAAQSVGSGYVPGRINKGQRKILDYMEDDSIFGDSGAGKAGGAGAGAAMTGLKVSYGYGLEDAAAAAPGYGFDEKLKKDWTDDENEIIGVPTGVSEGIQLSMDEKGNVPTDITGAAWKPETQSVGGNAGLQKAATGSVSGIAAGNESGTEYEAEVVAETKTTNIGNTVNKYKNIDEDGNSWTDVDFPGAAPVGAGSMTERGAAEAGRAAAGAAAAGAAYAGSSALAGNEAFAENGAVSAVKAAHENEKKLTNSQARAQSIRADELNVAASKKPYVMPPLSLLSDKAGGRDRIASDNLLRAKAAKLEETFANFHVDAHVVQVTQGPAVTRYEVHPSVGVKVNSIVRLADDIALNMEAKSIRIEAPIPGKAAVGIEIENDRIEMVSIKEVIDSAAFRNSKSKISFAVGRDIAGNAIVGDLKGMPHMLIAGATGSGKSVCINSIIISLLYKAKPDEVKLILVDPKVVELGNYNGIPHLLIPVVTEPQKAAAALNWAVAEMNDRYKKFAAEGARDLASYNDIMKEKGESDSVMPQIVIIIDELADLMMAAPSQVEESICRLAQLARAAGMHLIVATQRPSVDVITGVIKANIPSRIAFAVTSQVDSRTILDSGGAEKLVGKGDMLYKPQGTNTPIRVQGNFVSDSEVHKVIEFVKAQAGEAAYSPDVVENIERATTPDTDDDVDELLPEAIEAVVMSGQASVSMLQRRFRIGYNRAARIVDMMESRGVIGPQDGSRPRQVLWSEEDLSD